MNSIRAIVSKLSQLVILCALLLASTSDAHDPMHPAKHIQSEHSPHPTSATLDIDLESLRMLVTSFRETGDDHFLDRAWVQLQPIVDMQYVASETLVIAAFVAQSRHEFALAVALLERALTANSRNDEAWLLLASIQSVLGETDLAAFACRQLRGVPPLVTLSCHSRAALTSDGRQMAFDRLQAVLAATNHIDLPNGIRAWAYSVAGDLGVASGEFRQAEAHYRMSLEIAERTQVRAALVDLLLDDSRLQAATAVLDAGTDALPLLVRRLIVAKRLGELGMHQQAQQKVRNEFERWIEAKDWLHAREMARFYVDVDNRPKLARRLAQINIALQKEPEDFVLERRTQAHSSTLEVHEVSTTTRAGHRPHISHSEKSLAQSASGSKN